MTNHDNRYAQKLVGNSSEFCRGLDAHGFADLKATLKHNASLSSIYPVGDNRKFNLGTPSSVMSALKRCWSIAPTSVRIAEDIKHFIPVLDKVIEHQGGVVEDEFLRRGRRAQAAKSHRELKHKARPRQRASQHRPPAQYTAALSAA